MKDYSGIPWSEAPVQGAWFSGIGQQDEVPEMPEEALPTPSSFIDQAATSEGDSSGG